MAVIASTEAKTEIATVIITSSKERSNSVSFFELPRELRDMVYDYALDLPGIPSDVELSAAITSAPPLKLLLLCKQTNQESYIECMQALCRFWNVTWFTLELIPNETLLEDVLAAFDGLGGICFDHTQHICVSTTLPDDRAILTMMLQASADSDTICGS